MPEQFLSDLNRQSVLREAPRPHRHRLWYFWPSLLLSAIFGGFGIGEYFFGESRLTGLFLLFGAGWVGHFWVAEWIKETRE